jgi:hypothetical protein
MILELKRVALKDTYTIGKLYVDGVYFCDTLEDKVRDLNKDGDLADQGETKVMHETAIPYGTYKVIMNMSTRFKRLMPLLLDVPSFQGIRIHAGNVAEHSSGCILVGKNTEVGKVTNSKHYEALIYDKIFKAKSCTIKIH